MPRCQPTSCRVFTHYKRTEKIVSPFLACRTREEACARSCSHGCSSQGSENNCAQSSRRQTKPDLVSQSINGLISDNQVGFETISAIETQLRQASTQSSSLAAQFRSWQRCHRPSTASALRRPLPSRQQQLRRRVRPRRQLCGRGRGLRRATAGLRPWQVDHPCSECTPETCHPRPLLCEARARLSCLAAAPPELAPCPNSLQASRQPARAAAANVDGHRPSSACRRLRKTMMTTLTGRPCQT